MKSSYPLLEMLIKILWLYYLLLLTQGLCMVLEASCKNGGGIIFNLVDNLLSGLLAMVSFNYLLKKIPVLSLALWYKSVVSIISISEIWIKLRMPVVSFPHMFRFFHQACSLPDYSNPISVKNHNEVLRCFSVLSKYNTLCILWFMHVMF